MFKKILLLILVFSFASCIPNKDLIYLQGKPKESTEIQKSLRTPYRLQVDDNLIIDIKSSNEDLVAFFSKSSSSNVNNNNGGGGQGLNNVNGYFNGYNVDIYGNIRIPYIGQVNVLGFTVVEVRKKIEQEIRKFFKSDNDIFVTVKLSGIKYTIIGEIGSPGTQIILQNNVNILEAIANSGDITIFGDRKNVEIIRFSENGQEKFTVDLTKIDAFDSNVFFIKPNDLIQIKPIKQKSFGFGTTGLQSITTILSAVSLIASLVIISRSL